MNKQLYLLVFILSNLYHLRILFKKHLIEINLKNSWKVKDFLLMILKLNGV